MAEASVFSFVERVLGLSTVLLYMDYEGYIAWIVGFWGLWFEA